METVGRLAGGIAHDFNNLLTPILGYGQLAAERLPAHHPIRENLLVITKAAKRAANLVHQLLAFSRQQVVEPTIFCPNSMISETEPMLRRLISEDIDLVTLLDEGLGAVRADQGQLGQVLMNLVVNSRDAMPHGGKITISTYNYPRGSNFNLEDPDPPPGEHVVLADARLNGGRTLVYLRSRVLIASRMTWCVRDGARVLPLRRPNSDSGMYM